MTYAVEDLAQVLAPRIGSDSKHPPHRSPAFVRIRSSFFVDEIDVTLDDGTALALIAKAADGDAIVARSETRQAVISPRRRTRACDLRIHPASPGAEHTAVLRLIRGRRGHPVPAARAHRRHSALAVRRVRSVARSGSLACAPARRKRHPFRGLERCGGSSHPIRQGVLRPVDATRLRVSRDAASQISTCLLYDTHRLPIGCSPNLQPSFTASSTPPTSSSPAAMRRAPWSFGRSTGRQRRWARRWWISPVCWRDDGRTRNARTWRTLTSRSEPGLATTCLRVRTT